MDVSGNRIEADDITLGPLYEMMQTTFERATKQEARLLEEAEHIQARLAQTRRVLGICRRALEEEDAPAREPDYGMGGKAMRFEERHGNQ